MKHLIHSVRFAACLTAIFFSAFAALLLLVAGNSAFSKFALDLGSTLAVYIVFTFLLVAISHYLSGQAVRYLSRNSEVNRIANRLSRYVEVNTLPLSRKSGYGLLLLALPFGLILALIVISAFSPQAVAELLSVPWFWLLCAAVLATLLIGRNLLTAGWKLLHGRPSKPWA